MIDFDATVLAAAQASFAETVTWQPLDQQAAQVAAIFFDAMIEDKWHDGVPVTERVSRIDVRRSAFPRPPLQGDLVMVRGRLFTVAEAMDDGVGSVSLRIRLADDAQVARVARAAGP